MTQQPEALRLADLLETNIWDGVCTSCERNKAADELRRLSEENTEQSRLLGMSAERELRLRAINAQLLEALIRLLTDEDYPEAERQARAAIAAAKGEA